MRIANVKSKKLDLVKKGDMSGIHPSHIIPLTDALMALRLARSLKDIPASMGLHPLKFSKGKQKASRGVIWSVKISAQWRLTFRVCGDEIRDLDYIQYH